MADPKAHPRQSERIGVSTTGGTVDTYLARPASLPAPGVLLVHEVFGLTPHIEGLADKLAAEGYVAIVPDLFTSDSAARALSVADVEAAIAAVASGDPDLAIEQLPADQRQGARNAMAWRSTLPGRSGDFVSILTDVTGWLRGQEEVAEQSIGSVGWCFGGGLLGALICTGIALDAAIVYYGNPPVDGIDAVQCPVLGHYGSEDPRITDNVPAFQQAMATAGKSLTTFIYDAPHAFNNDTRASYRPDAANLAWERTADFLDRHLC